MSYFNMNEVPLGTEVKIKNSDLRGRIVEIFHYPTTFKIEFEDGRFDVCKTHEIEIVDNNIAEGRNE